MKRLALVAIAFVSFAVYAVADQINFNFTIGAPASVTATSAGGLTAGTSMLTSISDTTTNVNIPFTGSLMTITTGSAVFFSPLGVPPNFTALSAAFNGAGANSVLVVDTSMNPLVAGSMMGGSSFFTPLPGGTGSFLGNFNVSFVSPTVLAMFGLGPKFQPIGSVAFTSGNDQYDGTTGTLTGAIGGGSVTIQTPGTVVPEPASLGLLGLGLLTIVGGIRKLNTDR